MALFCKIEQLGPGFKTTRLRLDGLSVLHYVVESISSVAGLKQALI
jgi:hypothetical protein